MGKMRNYYKWLEAKRNGGNLETMSKQLEQKSKPKPQEPHPVTGKYDPHKTRSDYVQKSKCCYYDASKQYCSAYRRACQSAIYCKRYRVGTEEKLPLPDDDIVGQGVLFVPAGSMDSMIKEYKKEDHPCPICLQPMNGKWMQRGDHSAVGICSCSTGHDFLVHASFELMDDDAVVRQKMWQLTFDLFADYYSEYVDQCDKAILKRNWKSIMRKLLG